jgi:hypothetical protein
VASDYSEGLLTSEPAPTPPAAPAPTPQQGVLGSKTTTPPAKHGVSAKVARIKGANVWLRMTCEGSAPCTGTLQLVVHSQQKRVVVRHGQRRVVVSTHIVVIARSAYSLAPGHSKTIRVKLTRNGRRLLNRAGKRGLKVRLVGSGVKASALILRAPPQDRLGSFSMTW